MENNKPNSDVTRPGRPRTIDRDRLLDAAETIVVEEGPAALTIDAVAKATGVTKGGVQYAFGTKEAMVEAMFERWDQGYAAVLDGIVGSDPSPVESVRGHMEATHRWDAADSAKSAALLAALLRSPASLASTRRWYRARIARLDLSRQEDRNARLAFLATEGAFMLRFFGLIDMDEAEWDDVFGDVQTLFQD